MERSTLRLAGWLLAALLLAAPLSARAAEPSPVTIKVMTFNIWLGGDQVSFQKVIEAIKAADADIVCLQEAGGQTARIAAALGWNYAVPGRHVIARVPLFAPQAASEPVYKLVASAMANARVKADASNSFLDEQDLVISRAFVDEGTTLKRFQPRAQGRAFKILKRTSHITIEVATPDEFAEVTPKNRKPAKKEGAK